jgi:hypothetical protein
MLLIAFAALNFIFHCFGLFNLLLKSNNPARALRGALSFENILVSVGFEEKFFPICGNACGFALLKIVSR